MPHDTRSPTLQKVIEGLSLGTIHEIGAMSPTDRAQTMVVLAEQKIGRPFTPHELLAMAQDQTRVASALAALAEARHDAEQAPAATYPVPGARGQA